MNAYYKGQPIFGPRGPAGPDGNPIGTVISFMGITAPEDYLVCDGAEYSISLYPALASFFEAQFGAKNHFGGDGTATFAVPDMRNLFLRGYRGDSEEQLSGEIGEKQEATLHPHIFSSSANLAGYIGAIPDKVDSTQGENTGSLKISTSDGIAASKSTLYTSRPINMAVLYCIKAVESTTGGNSAGEIYSTDETRIGTWIDGKPLYRKVFSLKVPSDVSSVNSAEWVHYDASVDLCVKINGIIKRTSQQTYEIPYYISGDNFLWVGYNLPVHATSPNSVRIIGRSNLANAPACVIMEYTKTTD